MDRARRTRHDAGPERREVELLEARMVKHRDIHRRNAVCRSALLALNRLHNEKRIELLEEHHRGAVVDAAHHAEDTAEAVEERHWDANAVARGEILARADPEAVVRDVAVGELHALREASRAARVLHVHDVVHVARRLTRDILLLRHLARERLHLVERVHAAMLLRPQVEHPLEVRVLRALEGATRALLELGDKRVDDFDVVAIAVAVDHEQVLGVRLLEREVDFLALVVDVERQEYRADLRRREHEDDPVGDVRRPERDLFSALHAERHKPLRDVVDFLGELEPREAVVAVSIDHRIVLAAARDRLVEKLAKRVLARNRQVVPRNASRDGLSERRLARRCSKWICQFKHTTP